MTKENILKKFGLLTYASKEFGDIKVVMQVHAEKAMQQFADQQSAAKDKRIFELERMIKIMSKSLATYGEHPIIEGQVNRLLNTKTDG